MSCKRKRHHLSLHDKLEIIRLHADGTPQVKIAQDYGVSSSTICKILKKKEDHLKAATDNLNGDRKRRRTGKCSDVENALSIWFKNTRGRDGYLSGAVLEEKANEFAQEMGIDSFKATQGWLSRWKDRQGISHKKCHGEKADADVTGADTWTTTVLPQLLKDYKPDEIYNADETGIYYRMMPDGTLAYKNEKVAGGKKAKDRLSVLVTANMDGSDKRDLFIIGKSKKPRCFKGVKELPVPYTANANAWMTGALFREWLQTFEKDMAKKKKKIALILDNCSAHPKDAADDLPHIKLYFLPPNTTSIIQPCDMGIIRNLKANYRKKVVSKTIAYIDSGEGDLTAAEWASKFTVLDAMHMLKVSWNDVKTTSIQNCFRKAGFTNLPVPDDDIAEIDVETPPQGMTADSFNAFIESDDNIDCYGPISDQEIIDSVRNRDNATVNDDDDDDDTTPTPPAPPPKLSDALLALSTLRSYLENTGGSMDNFYPLEEDIQTIATTNVKQTITGFFSSKNVTDFFNSFSRDDRDCE